jgi:gliding motility-associated-like protein
MISVLKQKTQFLILQLLLFISFNSNAQICNPTGNLFILSNYDGGIVTINVDQNIPNLKIGICTYEPVQVNITGPFVGNVTQVIYAGFNSNQLNNNCSLGNFPTSITGVPAGIVTINPPNSPPQVGYTPAHGNGAGPWGGGMIGAVGACDTLNSAGGGNTPDEIVYYFETQTGGTLFAHNTQYSCWLNSTVNISAGGTCCIEPPTSNPTPTNICNSNGNVILYSNYEGGPITINVDQNIPNLKIGICTYEATAVNIVGPFVGNVTEVVYAGFDAPNNSNCGPNIPTTIISGVSSSIVSLYSASQGNIAIANYFGEDIFPGMPLVNCMVGAEGDCSTSNAGGGNSAPQIVQFFLAEFGPGSILYSHTTDYSCFTGTYAVSAGGNCCLETPSTDPNPIYTTGGTNYDFIPQTTYSLCGGPLVIDLSSYPVLFQPPTYPGYVWSNGVTGPQITITTPGTYSFVVGDYCHYGGVFLTDTIVVTPCCTPPPNPTVNILSQPTCSSPTGSIQVTFPLGVGYEYSVDGINYQSSPIFNGLAPGTYSVFVMDVAQSCVCDIPASVTILPISNLPTLTVQSVQNPSCLNPSSGAITVAGSGGITPYSFSWNPNVGSTNSLSNLQTGIYIVTLEDGNGCEISDTIILTSPLPITIQETIVNPDCSGSLGSISINLSNSTNPVNYNWSPTFPNSSTISNLTAGNYVLTVTDANGCTANESYTLVNQGNLTLTINPPSSLINIEDSVSINVSGAENFSWSPSVTLSCSNCPNPIATPLVTTTYSVVGTNANGCSGTSSITITVQENCGEIFVPTIFSPDEQGNQSNNIACVLGTCISSMTYQIFDRWGTKIYESTSQSDCWDGTIKGVPANPGVYVYKVQVTRTDGTIFEESGNLTLIR